MVQREAEGQHGWRTRERLRTFYDIGQLRTCSLSLAHIPHNTLEPQPNPNTLTISSSTPVTTHDKVTASTMSHANESLLAHETKQGDTPPVAGMVDDVSKIRGAIPHAMGAPDSQDMRRAMPLALEDVEVGPIPFTAKLVSLLPCFLPCMACNSCYVLQPREEAAILHLGTRTERTERTERKECTLCTLLCTVYCTVYGA